MTSHDTRQSRLKCASGLLVSMESDFESNVPGGLHLMLIKETMSGLKSILSWNYHNNHSKKSSRKYP